MDFYHSRRRSTTLIPPSIIKKETRHKSFRNYVICTIKILLFFWCVLKLLPLRPKVNLGSDFVSRGVGQKRSGSTVVETIIKLGAVHNYNSLTTHSEWKEGCPRKALSRPAGSGEVTKTWK